jgi:hypothetical protein
MAADDNCSAVYPSGLETLAGSDHEADPNHDPDSKKSKNNPFGSATLNN